MATTVSRKQAEAVVTALFRSPRASGGSGPRPVGNVIAEQLQASMDRHPASRPRRC